MTNLSTPTPFQSRSALRLPLMSSPVRGGFPSPADDYVEARIDLNEEQKKRLETVARRHHNRAGEEFALHALHRETGQIKLQILERTCFLFLHVQIHPRHINGR